MDKKIIHGVEVSDVKVKLDLRMNGAPITPCVWFKLNGYQTLEWLKKTDDGAFWVDRSNALESPSENDEIVAITGINKYFCDDFLEELFDYLDGIVCEQSQEAMSANPGCYELRFCYGKMPQVGGIGSNLDPCVLCAQEMRELEFYMRENSPVGRERYYIAQCVTHEVLKIF